MKLSDKTLEIMKNFSKINTNLFIEKDTNLLRTVADAKNIFASVEVEEVFPENIGIMNLHKLLQTISMFDNPDFTFNDTHLLITEAKGRNTFKYYYTDPSCLTYPKASVRDFPTSLSFTLSENMLGQLIKASSVSQLPDVKISYDNSVVKLELEDRQNPTSNVFSFQIDGQGSEPIEAYMKVENLKLLDGDYKMMVSDKATRLQNITKPPAPVSDVKKKIKKKEVCMAFPTLQYCIAMDLTNV